LITLVSFDVWNTLIRLDGIFLAISEAVAELAGMEPTKALAVLRETYNKSKRLRRAGELNETEIVREFQRIYASTLEVPEEIIRRAAARALFEIQHESIVFDDVFDALDSVRQLGVKAAVLGNALFWPGSYTRAVLERAGIARYLEVQLYADELGVSKPDRRAFIRLCSVCKAKPEESLHVGDGVSEDLGGALSAGMKAALLSRKAANNTIVLKEFGIAIIPSLRELANVVAKF